MDHRQLLISRVTNTAAELQHLGHPFRDDALKISQDAVTVLASFVNKVSPVKKRRQP
jgi:hypothetical protein